MRSNANSDWGRSSGNQARREPENTRRPGGGSTALRKGPAHAREVGRRAVFIEKLDTCFRSSEGHCYVTCRDHVVSHQPRFGSGFVHLFTKIFTGEFLVCEIDTQKTLSFHLDSNFIFTDVCLLDHNLNRCYTCTHVFLTRVEGIHIDKV